MPITGGVHALVRRAHEERVLAILREHGTLSRAQIAARSGLSRTTLSEITGDLLGRGAIVVTTTDAGLRAGSGRPAELLALDPRSGQFLGVDLGHTRVRVVVADAAHEIIASGVTPYSTRTSLPARIRAALALIDRLGREQGIGLTALQGVGVGVTGPFPSGTARADVLTAFRERFGAPVLVDNNTRFAALAEAGTTDARDVLYIRLADGIGGGLVVGGRLVSGAAGGAGEFGHVRADPAGAPCRCGKTGCLETVASVAPALAAAGVTTLDELAARRAEPRICAAMDRIADAVGRVLAAAALVLDPELVVIGGPLVRAVPELVTAAARVINAERISPQRSEGMPSDAGPRRSGARDGARDGSRAEYGSDGRGGSRAENGSDGWGGSRAENSSDGRGGSRAENSSDGRGGSRADNSSDGRDGGGGGVQVRAARLGDDDGARGAVAALFRQSPLLAGYELAQEEER